MEPVLDLAKYSKNDFMGSFLILYPAIVCYVVSRKRNILDSDTTIDRALYGAPAVKYLMYGCALSYGALLGIRMATGGHYHLDAVSAVGAWLLLT